MIIYWLITKMNENKACNESSISPSDTDLNWDAIWKLIPYLKLLLNEWKVKFSFHLVWKYELSYP